MLVLKQVQFQGDSTNGPSIVLYMQSFTKAIHWKLTKGNHREEKVSDSGLQAGSAARLHQAKNVSHGLC